jgi:hypothetical protein
LGRANVQRIAVIWITWVPLHNTRGLELTTTHAVCGALAGGHGGSRHKLGAIPQIITTVLLFGENMYAVKKSWGRGACGYRSCEHLSYTNRKQKTGRAEIKLHIKSVMDTARFFKAAI